MKRIKSILIYLFYQKQENLQNTCHSDYEKLQLNRLLQASRWHDAFCFLDFSQRGMVQIARQFDNFNN